LMVKPVSKRQLEPSSERWLRSRQNPPQDERSAAREQASRSQRSQRMSQRAQPQQQQQQHQQQQQWRRWRAMEHLPRRAPVEHVRIRLGRRGRGGGGEPGSRLPTRDGRVDCTHQPRLRPASGCGRLAGRHRQPRDVDGRLPRARRGRAGRRVAVDVDLLGRRALRLRPAQHPPLRRRAHPRLLRRDWRRARTTRHPP